MIVVKIGGSKGIDEQAVCEDIAAHVATGHSIVVVHGGSNETTAVAHDLGYPPRFVVSPSGHSSRYTDAKTMDIFTMVTAGRINKRLVIDLQRRGVNAVGLSGVDGGLIRAKHKSVLKTVEDGKPKLLRGEHSGTIEAVAPDLLWTLLEAGHTPVVAPIALGGDPLIALNVDGDRAAAALAGALSAEKLVILSNVPGLLRDVADESTLIPYIDQTELAGALDDIARGRMKRKLLGAMTALDAGVHEVILADGRDRSPIGNALAGRGTTIAGAGGTK